MQISEIKLENLDTVLWPLEDDVLRGLKESWYREPQKPIEHNHFVDKASDWFFSTKLNDLRGWQKFPHVDVIMGCTHYIESLASKHKWNIQVLAREYVYYALMGKHHTDVGKLEHGKPLIVSLPNYFHGHRPEWQEVLKECEEKNIDIHIDCAWITAAKGFDFDFDHPNIKSFAMSISKYNLSWNRVGLRWSKQRSMDSCTIISKQRKYNELTTACGSYIMDNLPRDYGWETYGQVVHEICKKLDLRPTMFFYVLKDKNNKLYSVGKLLSKLKR